MPVAVDHLRRRPPGPRVLVYLDQSTLSALALEPDFSGVREQLSEAVGAGRLVCPGSVEHTGETIGATKSWEAILKLGRRLSMGIDFREWQELADFELYAAAQAFFNDQVEREVWKEALDSDPHTPRDELFPGGFQVHAYFPPDETRLEEVAHQKSQELMLMRAYEGAREQGATFEEQVEAEFEAMVKWKLGPLLDSARFQERYAERKHELVAEWLTDEMNLDPGSVFSRYLALSIEATHAAGLVERFPGLADNAEAFAASEELRAMPALRYPAIIRAAIAVMDQRQPKKGDGYDIVHLSRGLSRCDIVTADASMTQLCVNHRLVPDGCTLLRYNDVDGLSAAVAAALDAAPPAP